MEQVANYFSDKYSHIQVKMTHMIIQISETK